MHTVKLSPSWGRYRHPVYVSSTSYTMAAAAPAAMPQHLLLLNCARHQPSIHASGVLGVRHFFLARSLPMPSAADDAARQVDALATRQQDILARIARLEATLGPSTAAAALTTQVDADASPVHRRLQEELISKGILNHRFVRAPPDYYDRPLEFRQGVLQAASVHHLCKSIIMENTRVEAGDPGVTKYYLIVCQYSARLHSEKLRSHVHSAHSGALAKGKINMRLCPEAVSDELTGFEHNAVSPIGIRTQLPILMSHRIAALQPDFFWLGGGEVDLKVGLSARDFMAAYNPQVVDCTYSDDEEGGQ